VHKWLLTFAFVFKKKQKNIGECWIKNYLTRNYFQKVTAMKRETAGTLLVEFKEFQLYTIFFAALKLFAGKK
jgi:hypothetical protein